MQSLAFTRARGFSSAIGGADIAIGSGIVVASGGDCNDGGPGGVWAPDEDEDDDGLTAAELAAFRESMMNPGDSPGR